MTDLERFMQCFERTNVWRGTGFLEGTGQYHVDIAIQNEQGRHIRWAELTLKFDENGNWTGTQERR